MYTSLKVTNLDFKTFTKKSCSILNLKYLLYIFRIQDFKGTIYSICVYDYGLIGFNPPLPFPPAHTPSAPPFRNFKGSNLGTRTANYLYKPNILKLDCRC